MTTMAIIIIIIITVAVADWQLVRPCCLVWSELGPPRDCDQDEHLDDK